MNFYNRALIFFIALATLSLLFAHYATAQKKSQHPYASVQPITEPRLFAEGIINIDGEEYGPTFTPDGKTIFFARRINERKMEHIFVSQSENGKWSTPVVAPFSGQYFDKEPFVSPDGKKIFFVSKRPVDPASEKKDFNVWVVEKTKSGWSAPQNVGPMVNSDGYDNYPAVAANGTLYFGSVRASGQGDGDLLISFNKSGKWTVPQSLGPKINTSEYEYTPLVSPDKKYLFFSSGWGKIYQIDMSALNLKP